MQIPRIYLGTMTFGWNQASSTVNVGVAASMVQRFVQFGHDDSNLRIDTARIYSGGDTEPIVKDALHIAQQQQQQSQQPLSALKYLVGTKAHPSQPGGLSRAGLLGQFDASCAALGVSEFEEYYLHQPDTEHSLEEALRCADSLVKEGRVRHVGMSNYHAVEVARAMELCERHGLTKPSVYQGLYNPLNRLVEDELLPILREHNVAFVAYNPLAAGMLTGRHTSADALRATPGRFKDNANYLPRFGTEPNFEAVATLRAACDNASISLVEATYRWLLRHSALSADLGDGLLIGASSMAQLEQNLAACDAARGPDGVLPTTVLDAFDTVWSGSEGLKASAFPYW